MFNVLAFVFWSTVVVAVVLAVARDIPIVEVFGLRKTKSGNALALVVGVPALAAIAASENGATVFGADPLVIALAIVIPYLWWTIA